MAYMQNVESRGHRASEGEYITQHVEWITYILYAKHTPVHVLTIIASVRMFIHYKIIVQLPLAMWVPRSSYSPGMRMVARI